MKRTLFLLAATMTASCMAALAKAAGESAPATSQPAASTAPAGQSVLWPAPGTTGVCPDTPLRIHFATPPALSGRGRIQIVDAGTQSAVDVIDTAAPVATQTIGGVPNFRYQPIIVSGNTVALYPRDGALSYGKTYIVKVDSGVFSNAADSPATDQSPAWQFTTKPPPPIAVGGTITVSADGRADFCTVQAAIDSIPDGNNTPNTILIQRGVYVELICFGNKNGITLRGQDRQATVIEYTNNNRFNSSSAGHIYRRGVLLANHCSDLVLENLTIRNTTPQGGSQAEAIILNGGPTSRAIVRNVDLYSYQDTLQINGQAYVAKCNIEGDVDFMWGTGPCYFDNCHCKALRSKAFYTQIRNTARNHGYVYYDCTFDGSPAVKDMYLSRIAPGRFPSSEVVLIDCILSDAVNPVGWQLNGAKGQSQDDLAKDAGRLHFWEFNSHDAAGQPVDTSKRLPISHQLAQPSDAQTIQNYSDPSFVLGNGWNPRSPQPTASQPVP